jgi:hypothetical protein
MSLEVDEGNLKEGLLGLVVALLEIIITALESQAIKRMEEGTLTENEINRLGEALYDLDQAIYDIKNEHEINDAVNSVRDGLDEVVDEVVDRFINPERWERDLKERGEKLS